MHTNKVTGPRRVAARRTPPAVAAAAALTMSLAACGGGSGNNESTANSSADVDGDFDSMTMDELYDASQENGEDSVMLYTVLSEGDLAVIAEPFEEKYPGIEVQNYESQGEQAAARLVEEAAAGVHTADVLDTEQNTIYAIAQEGLLAEYTPDAAKHFDDQFQQPWFTGFRVQIKPMAYNTDLIPADEAPEDYTDLLDPKWRGKICAEASEVAVFALMIEDWGEEEALDFWKGLVDNDVRFISGQTTLIQSIISGDCPLSVSANIHGISPELEANDAPVAWVETDPMYANYGAVGVAENAPHPYAARLWANFLLSPEGQQSIADAWRFPANPDVEPRQADLSDRSTYNVLVAGDEIMEKARELNDLYYTTTDRPVVAPD